MMDLERDLRDMMHRTADELQHTPVATPGLVRRARVRRAGTAILAGVAVLALVIGGSAATRSLLNHQAIPPANPRPEGIFADVGGWISYGDASGIWAVDPTQPREPEDQRPGWLHEDDIQLSSAPGLPRAWSPDGSKLLILRAVSGTGPGDFPALDLFVLDADGSETRLTDASALVTGGSFSRDGTEVVYAVTAPSSRVEEGESSIYVVDAEGGTPRLVRTAGSRWFRDAGCPGLEGCVRGRTFHRALLYAPTFSPDGTQIAYFDGMGDWAHSLRVMDADGSDVRVLLEFDEGRSINNLVWSPDGSRLAFATPEVWVVGADGSRLMRLTRGEPMGMDLLGSILGVEAGPNPHWSPDGSRISYNSSTSTTFCQLELNSTSSECATLEIARWDGTDVQNFGYGASGPWNPVDR